MAPRTHADKNDGQQPETGPGTIGPETTDVSAPPAPPADADTPGRPFNEGEPHSAGAAQRVAPEPAGENKIVTTVWAAQGQVPKASILQTAIQSVRDAIPVVFELEADITGAQKTDNEGQPGTAFEVTITYTPRAVEGKDEQVDLDKVVRGLDVPRSFDGIAGHEGDPDFLDRKPAEF